MLWKDWKRVSHGVYWYAKLPKHPSADSNGYVLEHRVVMENKLCRLLSKLEVVHHKNGNRKDNRIENLLIMGNGEHSSLHAKPVKKISIQCTFCGKLFLRSLSQVNYGFGNKRKSFCSRSCNGKFSLQFLGNRYLEIDDVIRRELNNGLTCYRIAIKHGFNKKTVYNHKRTWSNQSKTSAFQAESRG